MFVQALRTVREDLAREVGQLDAHALTPAHAAAALEALAAIEKLCSCGRLLLAVRATESSVWKEKGFRDPEAWLAAELGVTAGEARRMLSAAAKLEELPATAEAARAGELSETTARAIADAATADPAAEGSLLDQARTDADVAHLKEQCRRTKLAALGDAETRRRRIHAARHLRFYDDDEGGANMHLRHNPEVVAEVRAHLKPFLDEQFDLARNDGRRERVEAYAADAMVELARAATATPEAKTSGGPAPRRKAPGHTVVLVDLETLRRGEVADGEVCEIAGVGPVSVAAAREHLGESLLSVVITDGVDVQNVTVPSRHWTRHQATALLVRDRECARPGCHRAAHLEVHHTIPYERTRHSTITEAARVCPTDHDLITNEGHDLRRKPDGTWEWLTPHEVAARDGTDPVLALTG